MLIVMTPESRAIWPVAKLFRGFQIVWLFSNSRRRCIVCVRVVLSSGDSHPWSRCLPPPPLPSFVTMNSVHRQWLRPTIRGQQPWSSQPLVQAHSQFSTECGVVSAPHRAHIDWLLMDCLLQLCAIRALRPICHRPVPCK